jgi:hypothetical protein
MGQGLTTEVAPKRVAAAARESKTLRLTYSKSLVANGALRPAVVFTWRAMAAILGGGLVLLRPFAVRAQGEAGPLRHVDVGDLAPSVDAARDAPPGIFQPGTQPLELSTPLRPPALCDNCHGQYAA